MCSSAKRLSSSWSIPGFTTFVSENLCSRPWRLFNRYRNTCMRTSSFYFFIWLVLHLTLWQESELGLNISISVFSLSTALPCWEDAFSSLFVGACVFLHQWMCLLHLYSACPKRDLSSFTCWCAVSIWYLNFSQLLSRRHFAFCPVLAALF